MKIAFGLFLLLYFGKIHAQSSLGIVVGMGQTNFQEDLDDFREYAEDANLGLAIGLKFEYQIERQVQVRKSLNLTYRQRKTMVETVVGGNGGGIIHQTRYDWGVLQLAGKIGVSPREKLSVSPYFDFGFYFGVPLHNDFEDSYSFYGVLAQNGSQNGKTDDFSKFIHPVELGFLADFGVSFQLDESISIFGEIDAGFAIYSGKLEYNKQLVQTGLSLGLVKMI